MISGIENAKAGAVSVLPEHAIAGATADETFNPKASKAFTIWVGLVVVVLVTLFSQMRLGHASYNFFIEGGRSSEGATVVIDGHPVGTMTAQDVNGIQITGLRVFLPDGEHSVEVSKPGYAKQESRLNLKGEEYLTVDLQQDGAPPQQRP